MNCGAEKALLNIPEANCLWRSCGKRELAVDGNGKREVSPVLRRAEREGGTRKGGAFERDALISSIEGKLRLE